MRNALMRPRLLLVVLAALLGGGVWGAEAFPRLPEEPIGDNWYQPLSEGLSPTVEMAVGRRQQNLVVVLRVAGGANEATLAIGARRSRIVSPAEQEAWQDGVLHRFVIPAADLVDEAGDWEALRLGARVVWGGGPHGVPRQMERFRVRDQRPPHAPLPDDHDQWAPFSLRQYVDTASGIGTIALAVEQPMDGKLTVVIEDGEGRRIRNLVGGIPAVKGTQRVTWDGLDDFGRMVSPGEYRWRSIHHPGITAEHLFNFANMNREEILAFGTNHGVYTAACANEAYVFLAASITEGGYALIALDAQGRWQKGFNEAHGAGYHGIAIAADGNYFYAAHDGVKVNRETDKSRPDWVVDGAVTLTRYEIASTRIVPYQRNAFATIESYRHGAGAESVATRDAVSLAGMTMLAGRLYVASRHAQALLVVDPESAAIEGRLALPEPGAVAVAGDRLVAVSSGAIVYVDPQSGELTPFVAAGVVDAAGLAVSRTGELFVSDRQSHTVRVFGAGGKEGPGYGLPGGAYSGPYVPERLVRPVGLVPFGSKLWVTEDRRNPKRVHAWDLERREVVHELFGNPPYGSPAGGFDPADPTRWLALRCGWRLDFENRTARIESVLQENAGHLGGRVPFPSNYRLFHRDGRLFVLGQGKANFLSELMADGSLRDLAMISYAHGLLYDMKWQPSPGFKEAFEGKFPKASVVKKYAGSNDWRNATIFWVDANGDGVDQAGEYQIGEAKERFDGSGWGLAFHDSTFRFIVEVPERGLVLASLEPEGYLPSGAPKYPPLRGAIEAAVPLRDHPAGTVIASHHSSLVDSRGNLVRNSEPYMTAYSPAGELLWHYPNRWVNVHGSHKAPLPSVGEMQGNLFFLGAGPLDEQSDVTMLNGNHGRFFVLTTDGFYLDEIFRDCRTGGPNDAQFVGGEPFGGVFGRADDGSWYLQTGSTGYRIYKVHGLDRIVRAEGRLEITPRQLELAAERRIQAPDAQTGSNLARAPFMDPPLKIDGKENDWPAETAIRWNRDGQFPASARLGWDAENLYLFYDIRDQSPWVNNGDDWRSLFKTGDLVDLQLATDGAADPRRREAAAGDVRLIIAPWRGEPVAVLYRYGAKNQENAVTFSSPWRSIVVPSVTQVESARISVERGSGWYRVEAAIPLAELGLDPASGSLRGDVGVLFGDPEGTRTSLRSYWANPHTGLLYDVPGEVAITPQAWGTIDFNGRRP